MHVAPTLMQAASVCCLCGVMFFTPCFGGAWLQKSHRGQSISELSYSRARHCFGCGGTLNFNKLYVQNYTEQAITPYLTLFSAPEYAMASYKSVYGYHQGQNYGAQGGFRLGRTLSGGAIALQIGYKYGETFLMTVSDHLSATQEVELRPQFGYNFTLWGLDGYCDFEGVWRWTAPPRPNEAGGDFSVGLRIFPGSELMLQNFSVFSAGYGSDQYTHYNLQKAKLSVVQHLWWNWQLQFGVVYSWSGHNVVAERGLSLALWVPF